MTKKDVFCINDLIPKGYTLTAFENILKRPVFYYLLNKFPGRNIKEIEEFCKEYTGEIAFLKEDYTLEQRMNETNKILFENNLTYEKVAKRISRLTNIDNYNSPKTYKKNTLYSKHKPLKDYEYKYEDIKDGALHNKMIMAAYKCLWCNDINSTKEFEISRPETDDESKLLEQFVALDAEILLTNFDGKNTHYNTSEERAMIGDKDAINTLRARESETRGIIKKLDEIESELGPKNFYFTNILPHLVEKHHFFPNVGRYEINLPFFLKAIF